MGDRTWKIVEAAWKAADNKLRREKVALTNPLWEKWRRADAFSILSSDPTVFRIDLKTPHPMSERQEIRLWLSERNADCEFVRDGNTQVYFFVDHEMAIEFKLRWYKK